MATGIKERYSAAINSKSLVVDERTTFADSDVLGAMGIADRRLTDGWVTTGPEAGYRIPKAPLAATLERLLAGDNRAAREIVATMSDMVWSRADNERTKPKVTRGAAYDMACACLAWYRHGTCKSCGGHGYELIPGAPTLSDRQCKACEGAGKIPFADQFDRAHVDLARWLLTEMDAALGRAGPAAMQAISQRMEL
jgi:hypothetical protein